MSEVFSLYHFHFIICITLHCHFPLVGCRITLAVREHPPRSLFWPQFIMREGGHRALKGACVENPREETTFRKKAASPLHHAIGWRRSGSKAFKHCNIFTTKKCSIPNCKYRLAKYQCVLGFRSCAN